MTLKAPKYTSVADPGCLSWIPDPKLHPSWIPDPTTSPKEKGEKNFFALPFLVAPDSIKL
jgi:hypothetical protein